MRKYSNSTGSKKNSRKALLISGVCLIVVVVAAGTYVYVHNKNQSKIKDTTGQINPDDINYSPPTETDKAEVDANKQNVSNQINNDNQAPASGQKQVTPVITSPVPSPGTNSTQTRVTAYIPGIFEDGGTCTATIKGAKTITQTSSGFKNVSTTDCEPMNISLTPGQWTITLSYSSATAKGQSNSVNFKVE